MPYNINRFHLLAMLTWQFSIFFGAQQIFGIFANYAPEWRCNENDSFTSNCSVFESCIDTVQFEESPFQSASMEFDWLCGSRVYLAALYNQVNFLGVLIGTMSFGTVSDTIGRRPTAIITLISSILTTFLSGLAPNWQLLLILRFLIGLCCGGHIVAIATYVIELILPEQRMALRGFFNWGNARLMLVLICYIFPTWRSSSTVCASLMTIPLLITVFALPESPVWLYSKGRLDELKASEQHIARVAGIENKSNEYLPLATNQKLIDIIRNSRYSKALLVLWVMWFTASICSYATDLNSSRISGNFFVNQFLFGVMLAISKMLLALLDNVRPSFNRRRLHQYSQSVVCVCFLTLTILFVLGYRGVAILVINLAGTVFNEYTWDACYLCAMEAMPTAMRASSVGSCSLIARVGALLSPTLFFLGSIWAPSPYMCVFVLGWMNLIISCACLMDTKGVDLTDVELNTKKDDEHSVMLDDHLVFRSPSDH